MRDILKHFDRTCREFRGSIGAPVLSSGYFASVIDFGGIGLALSMDGVGSKVIISQMVGKYQSIGIDCVAMNANDLLCAGAKPLALLDYIAIEVLDRSVLEDIARGLCAGAYMAGISIPGGETAFLSGMLRGVREGSGFDLAATAIGTVPLDRIITGKHVCPGDVLLAIESNGLHSNGYTAARRALFEQGGFSVGAVLPGLRGSLGHELLQPTYIYTKEILTLLEWGISPKALIHITGGGMLNLVRVAAHEVGFALKSLPPTPHIFELIQKFGGLTNEEMFREFNMGMGFCVIVPEEAVLSAETALKCFGKQVCRIGMVVHDPERKVICVAPGKEFVLRGDKLLCRGSMT